MTPLKKQTTYESQRDVYLRLRKKWKDDPERYCRQRLGLNPTWQQQKILTDISKPGSKVSVRSGHGIGKDGIGAGIIWWFIETHNYGRCACTAPSSHQLRDVLWGELSKWLRRSDELSKKNYLHPRIWLSSLFIINQSSIHEENSPLEWYAIGRTARKESPEALQGLHASDVDIDEFGREAVKLGDASLLFLIDEASGVPDVIFEVAEGALSSPDSRVLMLGNPTRNTGYFAASHKHRRQEFKTLHFRSDESPLVDPDFRPGLVRKFGENSNVVRVRCDGEFPNQDDDTLISLEYAEAPIDREYDPEKRKPLGLKRLGIDVARYGKDRTVFVLRHDFLVPFIAIRSKQDTMVTVGQAVNFGEKLDIDDIAVDVVQLGSGVYDRLVEIMQDRKRERKWYCTVTAVDAASTAPPKHTEHVGQGYKLRDWLWIEAERWLREDEPCFIADKEHCQTLAGELATPKMKPHSSGCIVIESKDDMVKRLSSSGVSDFAPSPDCADSLNCTFSPIKEPPPMIAPGGETHVSRWKNQYE